MSYNEDLPYKILKALESVVSTKERPVGLHEPRFGEKEKQYVLKCIEEGWVSYAGSFVKQFESDLAKYFNVKKVIATTNGTVALHLALIAAGIQKGHEVLIPSLTFVATANAIKHAGAIPHFVDCSYETLGLDSEKLEHYLKKIAIVNEDGRLINSYTGNVISAIVPVHIFGHPVDMESLLNLVKTYNLIMIEDAAESLGSYYKGKPVGIFGKLGVLSFNGNKIITTGGGGAILTDDEELGDSLYHLSTTAKKSHPWEFYHDRVAYNYRMPNINAALGCAQLETLNEKIEEKRKLSQKYKDAFSSIEEIDYIVEPKKCKSNYWLNAIMIKEPSVALRDKILNILNIAGFRCRPIWQPLHTLPMYENAPRMEDLSITLDISRRLINLPSSPFLAHA